MNAEPPLFGSAPSVPPPSPTGSPPSKQERQWAMFCHLAAFAWPLLPPFGGVLGPLVLWLLKKDEYPLVNDQGRESVNFQLSMLIYFVIGCLLWFILIGILVLAILLVFGVIVVSVAAIKANEGIAFRYPVCIRFIK